MNSQRAHTRLRFEPRRRMEQVREKARDMYTGGRERPPEEVTPCSGRNRGSEADLGDGRRWVLGRGNSRDKSFAPRVWLESLRKSEE